MHDFDYDVLQKKRLARNAKYKKNGFKSKKCTLPSDSLTWREKQKMNGEVKTYSMRIPYSWEEFKSMPLDIKREYLIHLRDTFGVKGPAICKDLFRLNGITALRNYSYSHDNCFGGIFATGKTYQTKEQVAAWKTFTSEPPENPINRPSGRRVDALFSEYNKDNSVKVAIEKPVETPTEPQNVKVSTCSITLSGPADVKTLCKSLYNILNAQSNGRQVSSFKFKCTFSMEE